MAIVTSALSAGVSVVTDRQEGFLREILVAPLGRTGIVLGKTIGAAAVGLLQAGLLLAIAPPVGVSVRIDETLGVIPVAILLSLCVSGLGILLSSFAQTQQGVQMLINILVCPLVFLAGVFFPVDSVPLWMAIMSKTNPVAYGVDAIRQILLGPDISAGGLGVTLLGHTRTTGKEMIIIGGLAAILLSVAVWRFARKE